MSPISSQLNYFLESPVLLVSVAKFHTSLDSLNDFSYFYHLFQILASSREVVEIGKNVRRNVNF